MTPSDHLKNVSLTERPMEECNGLSSSCTGLSVVGVNPFCYMFTTIVDVKVYQTRALSLKIGLERVWEIQRKACVFRLLKVS